MRVIAIDPGRTTGYCYARINGSSIYYVPFQMADDVDDLWHRLIKFNPAHVVIEDFEFRGGARKGLDLFPVQLIGVARLWHSLSGVRQGGFFVQKAATGKAYYTDNVLKSKKLHVRAIPHGMDASRHLLQWFTFGYGNQFCGTSGEAHLIELSEFNL